LLTVYPEEKVEETIMNMQGKKVIALGERDGIQGTALAECAKGAGADVVLEMTHCFVWTAAGALDLEGQEEIKRVAERFHRDELVVLLGTPNAESSRLYALTVKEGDPSWAGVLAGAQLGLDVYHITEPEVKAVIPPAIYEEHVALMTMVLDVDDIATAVRDVRNGQS
jgi:glycine/sarcosine/betaine reductase complex component A